MKPLREEKHDYFTSDFWDQITIKHCWCGKWQLDYRWRDLMTYITKPWTRQAEWVLPFLDKIIEQELREHVSNCDIAQEKIVEILATTQVQN